MPPVLLKLSVWLVRVSAGAALALVRAVHAALRDSIFWVEQIHCVHILKLSKRELLYGHNRCWDVFSPLGNI